jgi:hypothetical protein
VNYPTQYQSVAIPPRLPLVVLPSNRNSSTTKDAKLVNCYIETSKDTEGELWIYKRAGYALYDAVASGSGDGIFVWNGDWYSVFGTGLYRNGTLVSNLLDNTGGVYKFTSILGATPKMVLGNGKKAYAYTVAGGLTQDLHTIDEDFPEEFVKGWAYIQGGLYVMTEYAVIWGSAINSVSESDSWDPLDFISAQLEPDNGVGLDKQLTYIIAFNQWSTEAFFYAGNPQGTPLGSQPGAKLDYGCLNTDSIQNVDSILIWLATSRAGSPQIALMSGLNMRIISTKSIDKLLRVVDTSSVYSIQVKFNGHSFYVITFPESNLSLAYDIAEDQWHQWTDVDGNYFPFSASATLADGTVLLQHEDNGSVYEISPDYYTDAGSTITVDIVTPNFDANTRRKKHLKIMTFVGDKINGSVLQVRCSDDDYQTWSSFRTVDMGRDTPMLTDCGSFRRRAWNIRHQCDAELRLQAVEAQYDLGAL